MKIEVTQGHINEALKRAKNNKPRSTNCPVALALRNAGYSKVGVGFTCFCHKNNPSVKLPKQAQAFIFRFDSGKKVKPFTFITNSKP